MPSSPDPSRWRIRGLITLAAVAGFLIRSWPFGRLGLNQFDEGIYALAAESINRPDGRSLAAASLIYYAPPGYPLLNGLVSFGLGHSDQTGLLISALMGAGTIPLAAAVARIAFGLEAGVMTAWIVCFAGPHIAFSRMGLTDATFLCCWSLGLLAGMRFLQHPSFSTATGMGCSIGLCQQIKYNGWLLGGLIILTTVWGLIDTKRLQSPIRWTASIGWGFIAIVWAAIIVFPWYQFVENHGGYAGLLQHQRNYLGGWRTWWPHLEAQIAQANALSGPTALLLATLCSVTLSSWIVGPTLTVTPLRLVCSCVTVPGVLALTLRAPILAGFMVLPILQIRSRVEERFLAVSWVILLILTPFYHPYSRLWLPFELFHWILLGGLIVRCQDRLNHLPQGDRRSSVIQTLPFALVMVLVLVGSIPQSTRIWVGSIFQNHGGLFDPSDSIPGTAAQIHAELGPGVLGLRTFVRPSMSYYLGQYRLVQPQPSLNQLLADLRPGYWALVDSTLLTGELTTVGSNRLRHSLGSLPPGWELVREYFAATTLPTALDLDPSRPDYQRSESMACFWLLRPQTEIANP